MAASWCSWPPCPPTSTPSQVAPSSPQPPLVWRRTVRSTSCDAACPAGSTAAEAGAGQVLEFGCWATTAEVAGLTSQQRVALLQATIQSQVRTKINKWLQLRVYTVQVVNGWFLTSSASMPGDLRGRSGSGSCGYCFLPAERNDPREVTTLPYESPACWRRPRTSGGPCWKQSTRALLVQFSLFPTLQVLPPQV